MTIAFADTVYWQALYDAKDSLHTSAVALARRLESQCIRVITSEMVLTEVLNAMGNSETSRKLAVDLVQKLMADANVEIFPNSEYPFETAFDFYRKRPDKQWGHTDCSSFIVMQKRGIYDALTHDHHFEQAGFSVLM